MSELGAGVNLNEDWDLIIDPTGDVESTTGENELQKDIAFNVARVSGSVLGRRTDNNTSKQLQVAVRDVLINDARIDAIRDVSVTEVDFNTLEVVATVIVSQDTFDLVFTVDV